MRTVVYVDQPSNTRTERANKLINFLTRSLTAFPAAVGCRVLIFPVARSPLPIRASCSSTGRAD